jgi:hypothetical protein
MSNQQFFKSESSHFPTFIPKKSNNSFYKKNSLSNQNIIFQFSFSYFHFKKSNIFVFETKFIIEPKHNLSPIVVG